MHYADRGVGGLFPADLPRAPALSPSRRVVVVYGDQVVMRPGLAEALAVVFGGPPTEPGGEEQPPPVESDVLELLEEAERLFELADEALQRWRPRRVPAVDRRSPRLIRQAADQSGAPAEET